MIYRATHRQSGEQVAIKIIRPDQLDNASLRRALRKEISTIADLDHPNIVKIYDLGEITAAQARIAPEILPRDAPWYAMEFVNGGSMLDARPPSGWTEARVLLLELLDALAHAHAAGVIHRDLKPGNVLLERATEGTSHIKLVDFGIAQILSELGEDLGELTSEYQVTGTPRYMSPEQVSGKHREHGPWSDLYALGCLAWFMLCGFPPFSGHMVHVMRSHLYDAPPRFVAQFPTPPGVEQWLLKLLAKQPHQRYRRAADAAYDLLQLPEDAPNAFIHDHEPTTQINLAEVYRPSSRHAGLTLPTLSFLKSAPAPHIEQLDETKKKKTVHHPVEDLIETGEHDEFDGLLDGPETLIHAEVTRRQVHTLLPLPSTWERPEAAPARPQNGASLGLFTLRMPPLIGRLTERDVLWSSLRSVTHHHETRAVLIQGSQGTGKTRLSQWLARRAEEVGACISLLATHDGQSTDHDGPRQMLTKHFRCNGLHGDALTRHLRRVWIEDHVMGLPHHTVEMLAPWMDAAHHLTDPPNPQDLRFQDPRYRYPHLFTLLERMSEERPLLLLFDDAHHSIETLHFVLALLDYANTHGTIRALVVLTLQSEHLDDHTTRPLIKRLQSPTQPHNIPAMRCASIELNALSAHDHRALIRTLLPLHPLLIEEVAQRTEGHPGFAFALLSDWVEHDRLIHDVDGLVLADHASEALPNTMQDLWTRRLNATLARFSPLEQDEGLIALEVGSILGRHIYQKEWEYCCHLLNISPDETLLEALFSSQLITPTEQGWSFAHPLLQEVLNTLATQRGALTQYHHHCATMLSKLYHDERPARLLRLAYHLARAGRLEEAIEQYEQSTHSLYLSGEYSRALDAMEKRLELIELSEQGQGSERWSVTMMARLQLLINLQRLEQAREILEKFDSGSPDLQEQPRSSLSSRHEYIHLKLRITEGRLKSTLKARDTILHACQNFPDDHVLTSSLMIMGNAHLLRGELELARHIYEIVQSRYAHHAKKHGYGLATYGIMTCDMVQGHYDKAERLLVRARALFKEGGIRAGELQCAHREIDLLRLRGKHELASKLADQLDTHFAQLDPPLRARHLLHKLVLAMEDGELDHTTLLFGAIERFKAELEFSDAITYQLAAALHHAMQRKPQEALTQFAIARAGIKRTGLCTIELATLFELLGHVSRDTDADLSRQSLTMATEFLTRLGAKSRLEHAPAARYRSTRKKT